MTTIRHYVEPRGQAALTLLDPIEAALGAGPAVCVDDSGPAAPDDQVDVPDPAVAVRTSGSTGSPKLVLLPADALRASADGTSARLAGPGHWLLALSTAHVAGLQVLIRSVLAGTTPTVQDTSKPFTARDFADAVARMPAGTRYASLVPTQLIRVLQDARARDAAASFDAILVGGASLAEATAQEAAAAGIRVVTTYGMSETCGGCLYDGQPLDGVLVRADDAGRLALGGPVVAAGYLNDGRFDTAGFSIDDSGTRWFTTNDLGSMSGGRLELTGRADDVIISGGRNVAPAPVEAALVTLPGIREALVVGVPDAEWGSAVTALIVPDRRTASGVPELARIRSMLKPLVGPAATPRTVLIVDELPLRSLGKPDRKAATNLAAAGILEALE
ncbi:o-succinylbenzoate--CoA ligase [Spelaeicoccus albus]|uniref:O-succinylbenzoic acid--CoA ligase n=1 Tax=Spelaeicoccus albus TaxID=1280376 RepID=A0A7Z0D5Z8_9MICO|nr:o-succinylbenzoate--CoA ligase [Spelaeicoccus albus]NYI69376.1 O-succinylbenzoic acid--CoA ligase [Spelaeicoccus albus]